MKSPSHVNKILLLMHACSKGSIIQTTQDRSVGQRGGLDTRTETPMIAQATHIGGVRTAA